LFKPITDSSWVQPASLGGLHKLVYNPVWHLNSFGEVIIHIQISDLPPPIKTNVSGRTQTVPSIGWLPLFKMQRQSSAWTVALIHRLTFEYMFIIIFLRNIIIGFEVDNDLV